MTATRYALWAVFAALVLSAIGAAVQTLRPNDTAAWRRDIAEQSPDKDRLSTMRNWGAYRAQREDPERIARAGKLRFMVFTVAAIALLAYLMAAR